MAYMKTTWYTGEPITQEKMNHIETGIEEAHNNAAEAQRTADNATNTTVDLQTQITAVKTQSDNNRKDVTQALQDAEWGKKAWPYVSDAMIYSPDNPDILTKTLAARLGDDEDDIATARGAAATVQTQITAAQNVNTILKDGRQVPAQSLAEKISDIDRKIDDVTSTASSLANTISPINGRAYGERLTALDANTTPSMTVPEIITEISNARGQNSQGGANDNLTQRFTQDEARIATNETNISNLNTNKVSKADIVDNLSSVNTDKPLSANQGRVINNIIGGYTEQNTVAQAITNAETSLRQYVDDYKVAKTDIYNDTDYEAADNKVLDARQGKVLKDAIDAINSNLNTADTGIVARLSTAESALNTLNGDASTDGSVLNTVNSQIATVVNEAPEAFDTLKEIADWIGENSDDALTMQQNISALDTRLKAIDGGEALTGVTLASRVSTTEGDIDTLETTVGDANSGLIKDVNDLSNAIDHAAGENDVGGLTQRITAAESAIKNAATSASVTVLTGRVTTLEGKDTIVKPRVEGTPNFVNGIPNISAEDLQPNADYLIQGDGTDNKYYYWRYIDSITGWQLISGAGSGGSGNTSGFVYTASQYNNLKTNHTEQLIENADYYVLQSDIQYEGENSRSVQAYHHYRYVKNNENVLQEIEIGEPISRAKTYTIDRDDDAATGKVYLNLYEFDYGIDNSAISDNPNIYLRAHIELPKGGGESSASSLKLIRLNDETRQVRVGKKIYLYAYFSAIADDQTENGKYVLKYNGITIDSGDLVSGKATDDPNNWVVIEDPKFTEEQNPTPIIASPDSTKLYIIQQHTDEGDVYTQWTYTGDTWSSTEGYPNGFIAFDVTNRCKTGDNTFTLTATAVDRNRSRSWNVNIVDLRLESNAPDTLLINVNDPYSFSYIPYGAIQKSLKITIDNNEPIIRGLGTSSGLENFYELTGLTHGAHIIRMQLTAIINGKSEDSDEIIRQYIWYDPEDSSSDVILASRYNNQTETIEQYSNIEIPYQVYKKGASSIFVYYYLDDAKTPFSSVKLTETNSGILSYVATTDGNHKLTIKVDNQEINVNLVVTRATKQISPVTGAIIDFDPAVYSNDAVERLPQWKVGQNTYKFTDSSNFNWSNNPNGGGYKEDEDGKCFVIKAGSYIDLNYNLFRTESEPTRANVFKRGAEMKIIFKVKSVRNAKAVWLTNTGEYQNKNVGLTLKAHYGELRTDKAVGNEEALDSITADEDDNPDTVTIKGITYNYWKPDTSYAAGAIVVIRDVIYKCIDAENTSFSIDLQNKEVDLDDDEPKEYLKKWLKLGQLNTEVISTDSYLYFPYSENDKIELDININSSDSANQFIMSYEDGVPSKAYAYTASDHLQHSNNIHIGSPDCDVYIYKLRIYDRALSTANILQNFIADGKTVEEKVKRHDRNCIYWNSTEKKYYIQKTGEAKLDPIKLAELMPDVKILMLDVPRFTTGKKDFIRDTTLRCIQADGGKVYPSRGDADNWFFDNGFHAGQGTTSDNYGQSARNVDFLFEVDGKHWPTKSKNMTGFTNPPDYQSRVWIGENASKYIVTDEDPAGHWVPTSKYDEDTQDWIIDDEVVSAEEEINPTAPSVCDNWMGDNCKISLTSTSIPNNYFNLKENVASSENVNNALFQKRYNDFLPYTSPAKQRDARIKNGMEFVPAVLFVRESGPLADHTEFTDTDWHFYGLGNLGDSKKTDYTRAYDPTDMYEFTCENSDNNTNNGQFQSGVFMYNNVRAIETSYAAWDENTKYNENAIVIREGKIYQYTGEEMSQEHAWDSSEWNDITPVGNETHYYAPRTNPDTMSYIYPITSEEWNITLNNNYVNRKHYTLVNEDFDGDHSFEFRYACCGDFRDGDRVNDTHGGTGTYKIDKKGKQVEITVDDVQEKLNHDVVCALYEWLVTSTEDQYKNEASQWMIKPAMEFFYAFTHYYTMMDNRAKNTFWHFAKTGEHRKVTRPVKELLHVYEESDNAVKNVETGVYTGTFTKTTLTTLPETYYVQGYLPVTDKHFKDGVTYYKLDINTNTYTATTSVNYTDIDGAPLTMTIKPDYEIPETAEALYTLGFIQTEESEFLSDVQYYTYTNNAYIPVTVTVGDPIKYLYTQYAFDLWVYDTDTALGIDNNGAQVFPYGKEDDDYRVKNEPSSGWAFNGAGSIFWRRLKTTFIDEIAEIMNTVNDNCFNSENLINEFDNFQNCFPEEIWRLDIERKYIRTFTGVTNELPYDNAVSEGKQNARFLMSMMQGRKKYQRRQWIRNQGVYFNSKYLLKDIKNNSNTTEFNIITPTGDVNDLAVRPTYNLQLTPYQDMYLNVTIGNGGPTPSIRAEAGKTYIIDLLPYSAGTFAETRLYIYGFKSIAGLGNLAPMYPYSFTLNGLEHLKELDLGTDVSGYRNFNLTALPFTSKTQLPLLEKLNIRNCNNLAGGIDLSTADNLLEVKADGTLISSIDLPRYTHIESLDLPYTVRNLDLYSAHFLKHLKIYNASGVESYTNLYTLNVYDSDYSADWAAEKDYEINDTVLIDNDFYNCIKDHTSISTAMRSDEETWNTYLTTNWEASNTNINLPVDWMAIASVMLSNADKIFLEKLHCAKIGDIQDLAPIKERKQHIETTDDKIKLSGTIRVLGDYSLVEQEEYEETWEPDLTLDVSQATYTPKHKVTYYYYDGTNERKEYSMYVNTSDPIIDIWEYTDENTQEKVHTLERMPSLPPTVSKTYQFGLRESGVYIPFSGWKLEGSSTPISQLDEIPIVENSDIIIEAYFKEEDRTYPIKWYLEKNTNGTPKESTLIKTSGNPVPYGGGYDEEAPTVKQIHDAGFSTANMSISGGIATYSIFSGWEKLPTNINPSATDSAFVIYPIWDSGSVDLQDLFADTTTFSPVQLLALSMMSTSERTYAGVASKVAPSKQFTYTMGYDSIKAGIELVGPNATHKKILRLGLATSNPYVTNIQPMAEENGFTLAIDYCFTEDATYADNYNDATLASCYYISSDLNTINGFALYDHLKTLSQSDTTGPKVGFGDMFSRTDKSVAVGSSYTKGQRNMVVLRHPAGSDKLYIYSGMNDNLSLADNVVAQNITWNNSTSTAQLVLGRITNSTEGQYSNIKNAVANGKGTIYWAKYWPEDLGAGECKRIASWPHEEITYAFTTYEDRVTGNNRTGVNPPNPALELVTFTTSSHGKIVQAQAATQDGAITGWGTSVARTVYNNRVFQGLPTELQAIVCKPEKYYKNFKVVYGSQGDNSYALESVTSSTRDYIYAPSANNLAANTSAYTAEELNNNLKPYMWLNDDTRVVVYNYDHNDTANHYWPSESVSNRAHYLNLRFNNKPITGTSANPLRIFRETSTSIASSTNIYTVVNNIPGGIKVGDIFIKSNGTAYMYVSNDDINNGVQIVDRTGLFATNDTGGWLPASEYWTRSMGYGSSKVKFVYVDKAGHIELNDTKSASESGLNINYALSI